MSKRKKRPLYRVLVAVLILALLIPTFQFSIDYAIKWWYPLEYEDIVANTAKELQLAPSLIYAVIHTESKFDADAVSPANAKGLMQLTDDTYQWALKRAGQEHSDSSNLFDPHTNIYYGSYVLVLLSERFSNIETVLAAYNAGQGRVTEWLENPDYSADGITLDIIPYEETAEYIRRVLTVQKRYQQIYSIQ